MSTHTAQAGLRLSVDSKAAAPAIRLAANQT